MKLALGTVQFGMPYGLSKARCQMDENEAAAILTKAEASGIRTLDTAALYGTAEAVLGRLGVGDQGACWKVVTKLPAVPPGLAPEEVGDWCAGQLSQGLERLQVSNVHGLLLHRPFDLLGKQGPALARALHALKDRGLIGAIGISIYGPDDLDTLFAGFGDAQHLPLDIVQAPCSVFDRRIETSGWAARLSDRGTKIHLRSVLLQGLLVMPRHDIAKNFDRFGSVLDRWYHWLADNGAPALAAALAFAQSRDYAEHYLIGVDSLANLEDILLAAEQACPVPPAWLGCDDTGLIDPREWMDHDK